MTHHTRQMIVDAMADHTSMTVTLGEGDTAWEPSRGRGSFVVTGPGVVTYRQTTHGIYVGGIDYPEGAPESEDYQARVAELEQEAQVNVRPEVTPW